MILIINFKTSLMHSNYCSLEQKLVSIVEYLISNNLMPLRKFSTSMGPLWMVVFTALLQILSLFNFKNVVIKVIV